MPRMTTRKLKALETKKTLLETGLELFHKKGFDNVTVDEIAKKCNVSKGAFYVHFNTKYDIFNEKFKDIDNFYSTFQQGIPKNISASEKILMFYKAQMIYLRDELGKDLIRNVYMNAMSLTINKNHYLADPDRNLYKVINSFVQEGIENNEFKEELTTEEASVLITRCMRGTIYDWIIFGEEFDVVQEMTKFTSTILNGLKK
ncbi:TetR/AcrR family transcriptional regulator [Oceanobacillus profundus]|uniref:TetR/AcrR family transcriptional regulator n=2 Tax=Oceanobacillus profundus TaxID=372463 RepID=A0A417YNZ4_9BACI|nr:TetR/AcrR family transcriptional regulator [Oceanobacillus profundus]MBR3118189.1 TetR/AcrR family transcriptional regulator [Oceanobacillus sp.]MCM3398816.1 TetR/AcrR family transcriptional regulator [Oceanobacillus profundus]PAE30565.1 TetR family transcriptional regulator [Paenibacillus sp. 7884-2]RHW35419.1 TetR/AcrR family transcriptional regulator [Oceanobacillus profundus]